MQSPCAPRCRRPLPRWSSRHPIAGGTRKPLKRPVSDRLGGDRGHRAGAIPLARCKTLSTFRPNVSVGFLFP